MADRVAIMRKGVLQDVGTPTQVYGKPATLYVAAFLGSPRMNLLEASVYVHLDRYVQLNLGEQSLYLNWNDIRARAVSHFHGERIVIGVRAEALTPVAADTPGDVLHGRLRYLEHHGHESLAFVDIGATAVVVDEVGRAAADQEEGGSRLRRLGSVVNLLKGRSSNGNSAHTAVAERQIPGQRESVLSDPGRHHRRAAELAVRLAPYPQVGPGHPLAVAVRMDALHFFDDRGDRIDVGWR
jgi:multiple sugar transport system ATP-binding protein